MMRAIRVQWENASWFDFGLTYTLKAQNQIRISDQSAASSYTATDVFAKNSRIKVVSNSTTIYGTIATLSSSSTAVIVDVTCDSGTITSTVTSAALSIIRPTNTSLPTAVIGIQNVVEDTTPQLGGNLDVNGNDITSPDGTDLIDIVNGTIDIQTNSSSRVDITDSGVRLGGANTRVTTILDEDTLTSDSATSLATQQSIKAYVDSQSGGGLVALSQASASDSASVEFTANIDGTYETYLLIGTDIIPASDGTDLRLRTSTDGGISYDNGASEYQYAKRRINASAGSSDRISSGATYIEVYNSLGTASGEALNFRMFLHNPSGTNNTCITLFSTGVNAGGNLESQPGGASRQSAADVDALEFSMSSGNIASGEFRLYGIVNS